MYKIAILGCENTHADNFLSLLNDGHYPDMEVVGVYSEDPEAMAKLQSKYGVEMMSDYAQLQGKVDAVMITARHGDNHYKYAKPYLNDGIPMFIDKPITCTVQDAVEFMRQAKERKIKLCGGSTCVGTEEALELAQCVSNGDCGEILGGSIAMPYYPNSPHGGFYFYAQHLIETMTSIFGPDVNKVHAEKNKGILTVKFYYNDFCVFGTYVDNLSYYSVAVYGKKGNFTRELTVTKKSFLHELEQIHALLTGSDMKKGYDEFIQPVLLMNAVMNSLEAGEPKTVETVII